MPDTRWFDELAVAARRAANQLAVVQEVRTRLIAQGPAMWARCHTLVRALISPPSRPSSVAK